MRSEELAGEIAGIIGRLRNRIMADPQMARALLRDDEDNSKEQVLLGIEEAIAGLVMLHIQLRR